MPYIFASDLDRTLIFSGGFFSELGLRCIPSGVKVIERKIDSGKVISYINMSVLDRLKEINEKMFFIPSTTRSLREYNRIDFGFTPKYAVVANGGTILIDGVPSEQWKSMVERRVNLDEMGEILSKVKQFRSLEREPEIREGCLLFSKLRYHELYEEELKLDGLIDEYGAGYNFITQRSKGYIIPKDVTKGKAVAFLKEILDVDQVYASGDGPMDIDLLSVADMAFIPSHAELLGEKERVKLEKNVKTYTVVTGLDRSPLLTMDLLPKM